MIVADDLTGALDSAVAFANRGASVHVARTPGDLPGLLARASAKDDVVAVSTGSRDGSQAQARAAILQVRKAMAGWSGILFKKIDSRLKGHIAAELAVLVEDARPLLVSPAIPKLGRICLDGKVQGEGVGAPLAIADRIGKSAAIPDIENDDDFDAVLPGDLESVVYVGAAGLAEALARRIVAAPEDAPAVQLPQPALLIIGSRDPITAEQIGMLQGVDTLDAPNGETPPFPVSEVLLVRMTEGSETVSAQAAGARFAESVAAQIKVDPPQTLFVSGGESAAALLACLDIGILEVRGEILPGVPVSQVRYSGRPMLVVTKSGGFGQKDTLVKLVNRMESH